MSGDDRLSRFVTDWRMVDEARTGDGPETVQARHRLLERYGNAARRYLLGAVRDPDEADELVQEFACKFLSGGLRGANPDRGRFRDYLKGVLTHLVADHFRRRQRQPQALPTDFAGPAVTDSAAAEDAAFRECWRDELLARAWEALAEWERASGQPLHTVLAYRRDHPDLHSPELAEGLGTVLGKPLTAEAVRKLMQRARERWADHLVDLVAASLRGSDADELLDELRELDLLMDACKKAVERRGAPGST